MIKMNLLVRIFVYILLFILLLTFSPGLPPYVNFHYYEPHAIIPFDGVLTPNKDLEHAERILEGKVSCPESLTVWESTLYSSSKGGDIITVPDGKVVAHLGPVCTEGMKRRDCSNPLGMRFNDEGTLFVADGNLGLFSVDITLGETKTLLRSGHVVEGEELMFFNDIDVGNDDVIYAAVASTDGKVADNLMGTLSGGSGMVIKHDPFHNETTVLMRGLNMAAGIQLSPDNRFLLVSEFLNYRVLKYHLSGLEKGKTEVFLETPGGSDNIRIKKNGNYLVPVALPVVSADTDFASMLGRHPYVRRFLLRFLYLIFKVSDSIDSFLPNTIFHKISNNILDGSSFAPFRYGLVLEVNGKGKIIRSLHAPSGEMAIISQATEHDGHLYLSSFDNTYIGKIPFKS